jgi:hypothetical protein
MLAIHNIQSIELESPSSNTYDHGQTHNAARRMIITTAAGEKYAVALYADHSPSPDEAMACITIRDPVTEQLREANRALLNCVRALEAALAEAQKRQEVRP